MPPALASPPHRFLVRFCLNQFGDGAVRFALSGHAREKVFVQVNDAFPVVVFAHALLRALAVGVDERAVAQDALEFLCEVFFVAVGDASFADGLYVFGRGERQHAVAVAHRFEERGVRAADFRGVDVAISVLLQRAVGVAEDETREDDATVASRARAQLFDVLVRVGRIADDDELVRSAHALEGFYDEPRVVLRFKARDVEHVAVRLDTPTTHGHAVGDARHLRAIGDHRRRMIVLRHVIVLNHARVGHGHVREYGGESFGEQVVTAREPVPLAAFVFEAVNVDGDGRAREAHDGHEGRVGCVADERGVVTLRGRVERGEEGVDDGVEIFVPEGGEHFQVDAPVFELARRDVV